MPRGLRGLTLVLACAALGLAATDPGCDPRGSADAAVALERSSADGGARAVVRDHPSRNPPGQSLWVGDRGGGLARISWLDPVEGRCDRVEWAVDGGGVAFLVARARVIVVEPTSGRVVLDRRLVDAGGGDSARVVAGLALTRDARFLHYTTCLASGGGCTEIEWIDLATGERRREEADGSGPS